MLCIEKRNTSSMENHLLKYLAFVRTVDTGSFTRAAESLNYAQSSASKMIGNLEREWGVALLERGRGGVCLTSAGEGILPLVRTVLNDQLMLAGHIDRLNGMQTGMVRIGTFASVAINWLSEVFAEFQKAYPGIEYEMLMGDYDEVTRWIDEGRVDCGFLRLSAARGLAEGAETRRVQGRASVRAPACGEGEDRHTRAGRPALSAAGARREDRGDGAAGEERRSPENKVHHVGGLRDNGDGREGAGRRHTAGADIAVHPVQDRNTAACTAVLPADRPCDEGPAPPLPRGAELRLLSQARRRVR